MDSATLDLYLQKLDEYVYDEEKIVTFKWLSCALNISISDSKQLLQQYVQDNQNSKSNNLSIIYMLSGTFADNTVCITLVKDTELEEKKDHFINILIQQIYSVQKSKDIDLNSLCLVDYFDTQNLRDGPIKGSIVGKNCIKRNIKVKSLPVVPVSAPKTKPSFFTKDSSKSSEKSDANSGTSKGNVQLKPNDNLDSTTGTSKTNNTKTIESKHKSNGSNIANIFNKINSNKVTNAVEKVVSSESLTKIEPKSQQSESETNNKSKRKLLDILDSDSESENIDLQAPIEVSEKKGTRNSKRPIKQKKKNGQNVKRRKRIMEMEESDDDIFGNDGGESICDEPIDDSEEDAVPVLKTKPLAPKNKRRKLVDKTFEDEDGFIVTRKEYVEESASEDETQELSENVQQVATKDETKSNVLKIEQNEVNKKPNLKQNGIKGKKAVVGNQPTLMNFFKKIILQLDGVLQKATKPNLVKQILGSKALYQ